MRVFCINEHGWGKYMNGSFTGRCPGPAYGDICEVVGESAYDGYPLKEWPNETEGWQKEMFIPIDESDEQEMEADIKKMYEPQRKFQPELV